MMFVKCNALSEGFLLVEKLMAPHLPIHYVTHIYNKNNKQENILR